MESLGFSRYKITWSANRIQYEIETTFVYYSDNNQRGMLHEVKSRKHFVQASRCPSGFAWRCSYYSRQWYEDTCEHSQPGKLACALVSRVLIVSQSCKRAECPCEWLQLLRFLANLTERKHLFTISHILG